MTIPLSTLASAVYMICLMWLTIIASLHLMPQIYHRRLPAGTAALWWLILGLSFSSISPASPPLFDFLSGTLSGYALLPIVTLAAALSSFAGLRALWWRGLITALPCAAIAAGADYLPFAAIAAFIAFFAVFTVVLHRLLSSRAPAAMSFVIAFALGAAAIAAYALGAPLIVAAALISMSAALAAMLMPARDASCQDRLFHLAITVPAILTLEWLIFGY